MFIQLLLATFFGMILGIERVLAGRTAGPRTYGLVALGACLVTIVAQNVTPLFPDIRGLNPLVMVADVISGVGFIGAGLIVFHQTKLSGLTTAAGIWVAAMIGIAVGFNFILLAFFATFLVLFIFTIMWHLEKRIKMLFKTLVIDQEADDQS